jgi:hypothetical protein
MNHTKDSYMKDKLKVVGTLNAIVNKHHIEPIPVNKYHYPPIHGYHSSGPSTYPSHVQGHLEPSNRGSHSN